MMKNDTFESLVPGPKCSGPKYFRAEVYKWAEVFSGPKYSPGQSISGPKYSGPKYSGPKYFWADGSVGPKLSLGQTGCESF